MEVFRTLRFRPVAREDLILLHAWLQQPHIRRWWIERRTYEEVEAHYLPAIEGREPTDHHLALLGDEPIGFLQTYLVSDYPDYAALVGAGAGVAGVDLLIGDESRTGQGLGTEMLRRFVPEVVFAPPSTHACLADPDSRNRASIRAFEKAGFRSVREFHDPTWDEIHTLVWLDRADVP